MSVSSAVTGSTTTRGGGGGGWGASGSSRAGGSVSVATEAAAAAASSRRGRAVPSGQVGVLSVAGYIDEFKQVLDSRLHVLECSSMVLRRAAVYSPVTTKHAKVSGDTRLHNLRKTLEMFDNRGYQRSFQQRLFHEAFVRACIKHIYKEDFASCAARLMRENRWVDIKQEVMITTPRRFGKTFSVALYVAAYAYSQPKCEISIFSTGRRASKKLLHTIFKFVIQLPNGSNMINKYNQETLELKGDTSNDDFRTINSYPSKVAVRASRACVRVCVMLLRYLLFKTT